jgi:hypothetical protein
MKLLPIKFKGKGSVSGFTFTLLNYSDTAYLYQVNTGASIHYEVFERRNRPICIDFHKHLYSETQFKQIYPKDKDFGIWAWTYRCLDKARKKFSQISFMVMPIRQLSSFPGIMYPPEH